MVRLLLHPVGNKMSVFESFNPTMVRLLQGVQASGVRRVLVSIPQWCDCCNEPYAHSHCRAHVSIPQWCDCCLRGCLRAQVGLPGFNPTMVRLLQFFSEVRSDVERSFNPTMVRLLPQALIQKESDSDSFNPTMVRLLQGAHWEAEDEWLSFNPTMVRLLPTS